jgi:dipeptidyl aminopeptidase/acylaminoacyl peptidase
MPGNQEHRSRRIASAGSGVWLSIFLVVVAVSIGLPATASATFAFNTDAARPEVWVSPNDDGSEAIDLGSGLVVGVSPDGQRLAFERGDHFSGWKLIVYDLATGTSSIRLNHLHVGGEKILGEPAAFAWSPDGTEVAAVQIEPRTNRQTLYLIGVGGAASKTRIATGHFRRVSFSPDGSEVVFGLARPAGDSATTNIARAPASGGPLTFLTHDGDSGWPLWGPSGRIAFTRRAKGDLFDLYVMDPNGHRVKRLTRLGGFEAGFFPAFWFPSGERLVADYESLEKNYAALVEPGAGTVTALNPPLSGAGIVGFKVGFAATGLSPDEGTVRGCQGSMVDALRPAALVPVTGGTLTVPNKDIYLPSWSGVPNAGTIPC